MHVTHVTPSRPSRQSKEKKNEGALHCRRFLPLLRYTIVTRSLYLCHLAPFSRQLSSQLVTAFLLARFICAAQSVRHAVVQSVDHHSSYCAPPDAHVSPAPFVYPQLLSSRRSDRSLPRSTARRVHHQSPRKQHPFLKIHSFLPRSAQPARRATCW